METEAVAQEPDITAATSRPPLPATTHAPTCCCTARRQLVSSVSSSGEVSLRTLANKLALSCECVALAPLLRGGSWAPERLAAESWAALSYLNTVCGAESVAVVAIGHATAASTLALLANGALSAHAAIALCPGRPGAATGSAAADVGRAARELQVPLLAVCGGGESGGAACAASPRRPRAELTLRGDFVAELPRSRRATIRCQHSSRTNARTRPSRSCMGGPLRGLESSR